MNHLNCTTQWTTRLFKAIANTPPLKRAQIEVQVKFIKEASIFDQIDVESLALFREMMADRYRSLDEGEE